MSTGSTVRLRVQQRASARPRSGSRTSALSMLLQSPAHTRRKKEPTKISCSIADARRETIVSKTSDPSDRDVLQELSVRDTLALQVRCEQAGAATSSGLAKVAGWRVCVWRRTTHRQDRSPAPNAALPHREFGRAEQRAPPTYIVGRGCLAESRRPACDQVGGPTNSETPLLSRRPAIHMECNGPLALYSP